MAKKLYLILTMLLIGAMVYALDNSKNPNLPFNPNEIVEQVSHFSVRATERVDKTQPSLSDNTRKQKSKKNNPLSLNDEFLLNASLVGVPAPDDQIYPVVASDGANYFIIWIDNRNPEGGYDIYGTLVDQSGRIIRPAGIAISTGESYKSNPAVAFDGFTYLVVWQDERNDYDDIYGRRVGRFGTVLDTADIPISTATGQQRNPSVAFDGINYLVVWTNDLTGFPSDIYGARVSSSGLVIDTISISISSARNDQCYPSVAFDGTNYLVVWEDERNAGSQYNDIYGARVNRSGVVLDTDGILITSTANDEDEENPSVAFDGTNYLVVWDDYRNGNTSDIYGTRVTTYGVVLDTNGFAISTAVHDQYSPAVTFANSNYFVVWKDRRNGTWITDIYGARVNQSGVVLDSNGIEISNLINWRTNPSVIFGGTNCLIVWNKEDSLDEENIYGARVNQSGIVLDTHDFLISTAANSQSSPVIAFDETNYLVVWADSRSGLDIYGTRVNQFGVILDTNGIAISRMSGYQISPAVAFDGINFLVIWQDYRNGENSHIYGTRMNRDGLVLDPDGILISGNSYEQSSPAIGFDRTNYLIVWQDRRSNDYDLYGTRITPHGLILDPAGIPISTATESQGNPSLAFDGTNYLVVWEDRRNPSGIYGTRVTQSGLVLDPTGIPISINSESQVNPAIAFNGSNYLVVWMDSRNYDYDIYGARVAQSGVVLDTNGFAIATAENDQEYPSVAFDGNDYIVVWQDQRENDYDIYGAKVNLSGVVIDSFAISTQEGIQESPAVAHGMDNQVLIAYSGWTTTVQGKTYNTMRIWGKFYPFVGIEEENSKVKVQSSKLLEVYPNPARSFLAIRLPQSADRQMIKIFDVSGKLVKLFKNVTSAQEHKQEIRIPLKGISPGIYFLRLGKETKKFLVVK